MDREQTGVWGEDLAVEWLTAHGFDLLHRNWRSGRYELDIVARREGMLHVVEVKSRRAGGLTRPEEAMTRSKFRSLCTAARSYIAQYGIDADTQFDLIAVEFSPGGDAQVRYIPNVMTPRW